MRNVDDSIRIIRPYRLYTTLHTVARPQSTQLVVSEVATFTMGERSLDGYGHLEHLLARRSWQPSRLDPWTTKARGEVLVDGDRDSTPFHTTLWSRDRERLLVERSVAEASTGLGQPPRATDLDPWDIQLASEAQQLPEGYFEGGEWLRLDDARAEAHEFQLPELRARTFARRRGRWEELPTRLDTVRLFPDERRGALIWRGLADTAESDARDIDAIITGIEPLGDPRPTQYYHELWARHGRGRAPVVLHDGELFPGATTSCTTCRHRLDRDGWHCNRISPAELRREGHPIDEADPPPLDRMGCEHHEPREQPRFDEGRAVDTTRLAEPPSDVSPSPSPSPSPGASAAPHARRHEAPPQAPVVRNRRRGSRDQLRITLLTDAFDDTITDVHTVRVKETISALPEYVTQIVHKSDVPLDLDAIVGRPVALRIAHGADELRLVHGIVRDIESLYDTEERHTTYRFTMVPRAFKMTLEHRQEIHLNRSVPDIIRHKLRQSGLGEEGVDFEMRLHDDYPEREFVVQYRETDLAFVSRLAEHAGISFVFEHDDGRDRIVFVDHTDGFSAIHADARVAYHRRGEEIGCFRLRSKRQLVPRSYTVRDYNYRTPLLELTTTHDLEAGDVGTVVEWGGHFKTPEEGARLAAVRAEEAASRRLVHEGESDEALLRAGTLFDLVDHPQVEGRLLLTEVDIAIEQAVATGVGRGDERTYVNAFKAVDAGLRYRPPRVAPVPRIHSVISGYVQSDHLGDIQKFAKIDDMGRYHVRFMFDHEAGEASPSSRPIRRAQPAVGPNYGLHFPLRPGMEVLMVFVDGDPDRPIIIAGVHHPVTPNPVARQEQTKNRLKTESGVLFEIEDGAGS